MHVKYNIILAIINIIAFFVININGESVPLIKLSVGDTVKINNLNELSNEIFGNVLNGYNGFKLTYESDKKYHNKLMASYKNTCLTFNSSVSHYFSKIFVNKKKISNTSNVFNNTKIIEKLFKNNFNYISNEKLSYGIIKICNNVEVHHVEVKLIEKNYASKIGDATHYVAYAVNGQCLFQVIKFFINIYYFETIIITLMFVFTSE